MTDWHNYKNQAHVWHDPISFIACGFGSGLSPWAPGTMGTVMAIPLYLAIENLSPAWYGLVLFLGSLFGVYCCGVAGKAFGVKDHPSIVWDEIIGYGVTMFMAPQGWPWVVFGFILFRLFDIFKPWPIKQLERLPAGWGVMADDILAGVFSAACVQGTAYSLEHFL